MTDLTTSSDTEVEISVVIPALNEAGNIGELCGRCKKSIEALGVSYEIIVVDGNSHDGTMTEADAAGAHAILQKGRGYGMALRTGFDTARGKTFITMDSDLSHEPEVIAQLWNARISADVVIASRYVKGGDADMSAFRYLLSRILNVVFSTVLGLDVKDISSGFRLYRREAIAGIDFRAVNFDVLEEILILIINNGGTFTEVPFHYRPRKEGKSHAKLLEFGIAYLKTLHAMRKLRRGKPSA